MFWCAYTKINIKESFDMYVNEILIWKMKLDSIQEVPNVVACSWQRLCEAHTGSFQT